MDFNHQSRFPSARPQRLITKAEDKAGAVETVLLRRIESNLVHLFFTKLFGGGNVSCIGILVNKKLLTTIV